MSTLVPNSTTPRGRPRLLGLAGAVLVNEALWLLATFVLGMQLQAPASSPDLQPTAIGPLLVAIASVVGYLAGWAVLAVLERLTVRVRARAIWLGLALVALLASLALPLGGTGIDAANRLVLVLMHLAVAAVLVLAAGQTTQWSGEKSAGTRILFSCWM